LTILGPAFAGAIAVLRRSVFSTDANGDLAVRYREGGLASMLKRL